MILLRLAEVAAGHGDGRQPVGLGLQQQGFLGEQSGLGPLDLGVRLVDVGLGPVGPHPGLVAGELAFQAAEPRIGEQVVEDLEPVAFEGLGELGIVLGLLGDFDGLAGRLTIRLRRLHSRVPGRLLGLGGRRQFRHFLAGRFQTADEEGALRIETRGQLRVVIFDIDDTIVHLDAASLDHVPCANLSCNAGGEHLDPLGWGICGDHAAAHHGLLPRDEGQEEWRGEESEDEQAGGPFDAARRTGPGQGRPGATGV